MVARPGGRRQPHRYPPGVIDLHAHLLPGLDDGPPRMADALEMARVAVADGIRTAVCTPHLNATHPGTHRALGEAVPAMRRELERAGIPLAVLPGAEIALDTAPTLDDDELREATLGGGGRWLLLELPLEGWPVGVPQTLERLEMRGFGVVLAHPERAAGVQRAPDRLRDLVGRGALVQVTAGSFLGEHGPLARRTAVALLRAGFVHFLASGGHSAKARPPLLADGLAMAAAELHVAPEALGWMVNEGPRLVIEGRAVRPPRLVPTRTLRAAAPRDRRAQPERRRR
jgi:protein-tyrosine phosphatase